MLGNWNFVKQQNQFTVTTLITGLEKDVTNLVNVSKHF